MPAPTIGFAVNIFGRWSVVLAFNNQTRQAYEMFAIATTGAGIEAGRAFKFGSQFFCLLAPRSSATS